jgi:CBS domain-containing protein
MQQTFVKDVMTPNPKVISRNTTLREAAQVMAQLECGVLPVGQGEDIEGIITDRDIVIRAIAKGVDVNTENVARVMTDDVCYCEAGDSLQEAAKKMGREQVNRLLVRDKNGSLCGIVTFGSMLRKDDDLEELTEIVACAHGKRAA